MAPKQTAPKSTLIQGPVETIENFGHQIWFHARIIRSLPAAITRYLSETLRILADISFGTGALAVVGGTVVITSFLTAFAGIEIGLQGYNQLSNLGIEALSGFVSAYINTRLAAPVIAGIGLVATIGTGLTAQIGAMRIGEEIDAIEVMGLPSVPFVVATRVLAGGIAIIPLYALALLASYASTFAVITFGFGQSAGAYQYYFGAFLVPGDILRSFAIVLLMSVVAIAIHCYYGYYASGGPAGVGRAVGRAVRVSLGAILILNLAASFALYGVGSSIQVAG